MNTTTRRKFISLGAMGVTGLIGGFTSVSASTLRRTDSACMLLPEPQDHSNLEYRARELVDMASSLGAKYADTRIGYTQELIISLGAADSIPYIHLKTSLLYGVRVLVGGVWGFVHSNVLTGDEGNRIVRNAIARARGYARTTKSRSSILSTPAVSGVWNSPAKISPFNIPLLDQADRLGALNSSMARVAGVNVPFSGSRINYALDTRVFASTDGSLTRQVLTSIQPSIVITSNSMGSSSFYGIPPQLAGFEVLLRPSLEEEVKIFAENFVELNSLPIKVMDVGRYPLIMDGASTARLLGGTLVPALELDRVLKYEADGAGTSYIAPPEESLGEVIISPTLTLEANRTMPGIGAVQWDDEGVVPQNVPLIRHGELIEFLTTRTTAPEIEEWHIKRGKVLRSNGSAVSPVASVAPAAAASQITVEPSDSKISIDDLLRGIRHGILIKDGDVSPDQALVSGQANGLLFEVKNGRIVSRLRGMTCEFKTPNLLRSVSMIGGKTTVTSVQTNSYKGRPPNRFDTLVSAPGIRFSSVDLVNYGRRFQ